MEILLIKYQYGEITRTELDAALAESGITANERDILFANNGDAAYKYNLEGQPKEAEGEVFAANSKETIAAIKAANTIDEVNTILGNDTRSTVKAAAEKRILNLTINK